MCRETFKIFTFKHVNKRSKMKSSKKKLAIYLSSLLVSTTMIIACNQAGKISIPTSDFESEPALYSSDDLTKAKAVNIISVTNLDSTDLNNEEVNIEPIETEESVIEENSDLDTQAVLPTASGTMAYYRTDETKYQIWKHDQATDVRIKVYSSTNEVQSVAVTSDGSLVVASIRNPANGNYDIYAFGGGNPIVNLTNTNGKNELDVSITADGTKIVWSGPLNSGLIKIRICDYNSITTSCTISQLGATLDQRQASITGNGKYITLIRDLNDDRYRVLLYDVMNNTYNIVITRIDELSHPSTNNTGDKVMYLRDRTGAIGKYLVRIKDLNTNQIVNELSSTTLSHTHIISNGNYFAYDSLVGDFQRALTRNIATNQRASAVGGSWDYRGGFWQQCPQWQCPIKKMAFDRGLNDFFGEAVAILGNTMFVGAKGDNNYTGSTYIYEHDASGEWLLVKKITASDGAGFDWFGTSVAISDNTLVIGTHSGLGSAYIFERNNGGINNWGEVKKIIPSDIPAGHGFGNSVAISGDTIVVGALWDDSNGNNSGLAYIFERNQDGVNNWGEVKKIIASDTAANELFGHSVAISGNTIIVGATATFNFASGSTYIFERNQGGINNWGEVKKIIPSDGEAVDDFGYSVGILGDIAVVGSRWGDDNGNNSGSAYIFERNQDGINNWGEVKKILASDGTANDDFGSSVAISGNVVVIGAPNDNDSSGSAYVFEQNNGGSNNWGQVKKLLAFDGEYGDWFGKSIAISEDIVVVGTPVDDNQRGSVYVYQP